MSAPEIILCALGLIGTWFLIVGACVYAHCRGDAAMGVADTQGREPEAGSGEQKESENRKTGRR